MVIFDGDDEEVRSWSGFVTLASDLEGEHDAIASYNKAVAQAAELRDAGTRELLERILADEERHLDFHEAHRDQVEQMGLPLFLANQTREKD